MVESCEKGTETQGHGTSAEKTKSLTGERKRWLEPKGSSTSSLRNLPLSDDAHSWPYTNDYG